MTLFRMIAFAADIIQELFLRFKNRVLRSSGIVEAETSIDNDVNASFYLQPSGYSDGKLFAVLPENGDGDMSFARASGGTRVNSSGDIELVVAGLSRLTYDGNDPSILIEPQSTNLITHSEDFSDWTNIRIDFLPNQTTAPDDNVTASKLVSTNELASHFVYKNTGIGGAIGTVSFFCKAAEYSNVRVIDVGTNRFGASFDLTNGDVYDESTGNKFVSAETEYHGDGWWRCIMVLDSTDSVAFGLSGLPDGYSTLGFPNYQGDGVSGVYVWGYQSEPLPYATSYMPSEGSIVTRAADVATLNTIGLGLSTITETFSDGTTNVITPVPDLYTMSQGRINKIIGV